MTTDDLVQIVDSLMTQLDKMRDKFQKRINELEAQVNASGGPYKFTAAQEARINQIVEKVKAVDDIVPDIDMAAAQPGAKK